MGSVIRKTEFAVATLLTAAAVYLHFLALISAGGLWRDEANTVGIATLPNVREVAANLQFDSFPILWLMVVRAYASAVGPMNDPAFRELGFIIGIVGIGALWFNARGFGHRVPLVSLAILALAPSLIVWGDSMRAYGFGTALILLTAGLLWRFVNDPSLWRFALALVAAVASVHTLFYNSVLLLAFSAGAVAVCTAKRAWQAAGLVIVIGALSAASLVPYVAEIRDASSWNALVQMPDYNFAWFWLKLEETLQPAGGWALTVWFFLLVLAVILGLFVVVRRRALGLSHQQRDAALFSVVTLIVGVPALMFFLHELSYYTQPWYYLTLLVMVGVCVDAVIGALTQQDLARIVRLVFASVIGAVTLIPASRALQMRHTNVDLISERLTTLVSPNDLVLVSPWNNGVSFERYYAGAARWETIPAIGFHRFHRYDFIKELMMVPDQSRPVRDNIADIGVALRAGTRVFVVGRISLPDSGEKPRVLAPAPLPGRPTSTRISGQRWSATTSSNTRRRSRGSQSRSPDP
jgi:hypothetical protein